MSIKDYNGVLLGRTPRDFILGGQIELEVNCNNWEFYLIDNEWKIEHEHQMYLHQNRFGFETYACTCFAGNDVKEMIMMWALHNNKIPAKHAKWLKDNGYFKNGAINYDDRVPAMYSEIVNHTGTYQYKAANALRKWSLPEGILKDDPANWEQYMDKSRVSQEAKQIMEEHNKRFVWHWFWYHDLKDVDEQMKMSPAMSVVRYADGQGCLTPSGNYNHAIMEYGKDSAGCRKIDDSYSTQLKKYHPNYITSRLGFKLSIIEETMDKFLRENDLKVIWNRDTGAYAFIQNQMAKVIKTKDRDVLALFEMRFRDNGKVTVSNDEWNSLPKGVF